jgi:hypothetical protein
VKKLVAIVLALTLAGCAGTAPNVPFLTKQTGKITIDRQEFIDNWSMIQVLWDFFMRTVDKTCAVPAVTDIERCSLVPEIKARGKVFYAGVEAKIRNPERQIDQANVVALLSLLAKFVL